MDDTRVDTCRTAFSYRYTGGMDRRIKPCLDCGDPTRGVRCRSCSARYRWATSRSPLRPFVEFEGTRYYRVRHGYWQASRHAGGELLHRAVWRSAHGPIPNGWHVHHRDHDPGNNDLANLIALPVREHLSGEHGEHQPFTEQTLERIAESQRRRWAGVEPVGYTCEECGDEFTSRKANAAVRFCSPACNTAYWNRERRRRRNAARLRPDG